MSSDGTSKIVHLSELPGLMAWYKPPVNAAVAAWLDQHPRDLRASGTWAHVGVRRTPGGLDDEGQPKFGRVFTLYAKSPEALAAYLASDRTAAKEAAEANGMKGSLVFEPEDSDDHPVADEAPVEVPHVGVGLGSPGGTRPPYTPRGPGC